MPDFDQARAVKNAGTKRLPAKKQKPVPLKADYVPRAEDDELVKQAYAMKQQELKKQTEQVQTQGRQRGYSQKELHDILNS